jgi:hypothetical protein
MQSVKKEKLVLIFPNDISNLPLEFLSTTAAWWLRKNVIIKLCLNAPSLNDTFFFNALIAYADALHSLIASSTKRFYSWGDSKITLNDVGLIESE